MVHCFKMICCDDPWIIDGSQRRIVASFSQETLITRETFLWPRSSRVVRRRKSLPIYTPIFKRNEAPIFWSPYEVTRENSPTRRTIEKHVCETRSGPQTSSSHQQYQPLQLAQYHLLLKTTTKVLTTQVFSTEFGTNNSPGETVSPRTQSGIYFGFSKQQYKILHNMSISQREATNTLAFLSNNIKYFTV